MTNRETLTAGKHGAVVHVNRSHIAMNVKDGGNRPVYTVKPNGPNSGAVYARNVLIHGPSYLEYDGTQLSCGARAWIAVPPGTILELFDPMTFSEAKEAA